ncbi:MAG TPA: hypothetical protein VJ547_12335 [Candidatus Thermoplasmatota archaeon]|nr:hypothetical protein [Candidatus Thermoplasmatota archaeon]
MLQDLVELGGPLLRLLGDLAKYGWDADEPLFEVRPEHVGAVLKRYCDGTLSETDVEDWANALEVRDDLAFNPRGTVRELTFELANPTLQGKLTKQRAAAMMDGLPKGG